MLYTNLSGAIVALVFCALTGQIATGLAFCQRSEVSPPAAVRPPVHLPCRRGLRTRRRFRGLPCWQGPRVPRLTRPLSPLLRSRANPLKQLLLFLWSHETAPALLTATGIARAGLCSGLTRRPSPPPQEFVWALVSFSLCSAMGQCFIYYTIAEFSPLLLATVTTTRKIFSTLVSVFGDPSEWAATERGGEGRTQGAV